MTKFKIIAGLNDRFWHSTLVIILPEIGGYVKGELGTENATVNSVKQSLFLYGRGMILYAITTALA